MTILIYCWGSLCENSLCKTFQRMGIEYVKFSHVMADYHADATFAGKFIPFLHERKVDAVFSFDYFPMLAMICEINNLPYISWIYDCPQYTLQSKTLTSKSNYIFCFDRKYAEYLSRMGAKHCFHMPLGVSREEVKWLDEVATVGKEQCQGRGKESQFACDVSFVGNYYNDSKNRIRVAEFSDYTKGYIEGLLESQLLVYGYNFLQDSLSDGIRQEVVEKCKLTLGESYVWDERRMAADALGMEVTARERELVTQIVGETAGITVYTSSALPESLKSEGVRIKGYVDYDKEMPQVFRNSRINLNITSRTIESGIPLRVLDIMNCGGFCLTNYQPEIAEYFADGEELVMYTSLEDLAMKVQYYLEHEDERTRIAKCGREKVLEKFELSARLEDILRIIESQCLLR